VRPSVIVAPCERSQPPSGAPVAPCHSPYVRTLDSKPHMRATKTSTNRRIWGSESGVMRDSSGHAHNPSAGFDKTLSSLAFHRGKMNLNKDFITSARETR